MFIVYAVLILKSFEFSKLFYFQKFPLFNSNIHFYLCNFGYNFIILNSNIKILKNIFTERFTINLGL